MKRFAKTIVKVLLAYADIVKKEFPSHLKEERIVRARNPATICEHSSQVIDRLYYKLFYSTGVYFDEQHPTTSGSIRKNVRVNGR